MSRRWTEADYARLTGQALSPLRQSLPRGAKPSKYRARRVQWRGLWFDSQREAARAQELTLLQQAGRISDLVLDKRQLRYPLVVNGVTVATYVADFRYEEDGRVVVEDVKGYRTREYRMKKRLMQQLYAIDIRET